MASRVVKTGSSGTEFAGAPQPLKIADLDADLDNIFTNIDNSNVKSGAGIATAKLAQDAGIQTGHLAALAVTTAKLAVGAADNSSASGAVPFVAPFNTVETTIVTLGSMTTRGGTVLIGGWWSLTQNSQNATTQLTLRVKRDGTTVYTFQTSLAVLTGGGTSGDMPIPCPFVIDTPSAGAHVYSVTAQLANSNSTLRTFGANGGNLFAVELA